MSELFRVKQPAMMMQLQDLGRFGYMDIGFSQSGPMDDLAFAKNNQILGNDSNAAQLEIAPGGLILEALNQCTISIAGAYANPTLDGKPLVNFHSYVVEKGQELKLTFAKSGIYSYIAVKGGFDAKTFLGSRSTCARLNIYPQEIVRNSVLCGELYKIDTHGIKRKDYPDYSPEFLQVIPSYQFAEFSEKMRERLVTQRYEIAATNRMGTLLEGKKPLTYDAGELLSEGIVPGAIQINNAGQPIVLQKDAQSIGGYPKIGVLTAISRSQLSQMQKGRWITFRFI